MGRAGTRSRTGHPRSTEGRGGQGVLRNTGSLCHLWAIPRPNSPAVEGVGGTLPGFTASCKQQDSGSSRSPGPSLPLSYLPRGRNAKPHDTLHVGMSGVFIFLMVERKHIRAKVKTVRKQMSHAFKWMLESQHKWHYQREQNQGSGGSGMLASPPQVVPHLPAVSTGVPHEDAGCKTWL